MTDRSDRPGETSRRSLLYGVGALAAGYWGLRYGIPRLSEAFAADFEFREMAEPAGFRRIDGGLSSTGFDPLAGIVDTDAAQSEGLVSSVRARVCDALFGAVMPPDTVVPVASFSDYNCPYCRVMTERLARMADASPRRIAITWHELPLFGESSLLAAKGALAAKRQGAYVAFHSRLMRSRFMATPGYLASLADDLDIDQEQLMQDFWSDAVELEIAESRALARIFGFIGTPAMVVGRTVLQGEISEARLQSLIDREIADGPITACV